VSDGQNVRPVDIKKDWVRPELQRIEAGSAESAEGGRPDISDPQRS
jgi:hypothetical protein